MMRHRIRKLTAALAAVAMLAMGAPTASAADASPFKDVKPGSAHYDDIVWLAQKGIAKGYGDGTFGGMRDVVRQDMAAFLYRAAGSPAFDQAKAQRDNKFRDVKPGTTHYKEVLWLTTTGITQGYPDGTFGGMRIVVRQDMAAFLHRYATNVLHATGTGGNAKSFKDINNGTPHHDDIAWLSRTGITQGYPDHTFGGMRNVVRQDMAAFIHRTNNLKTTSDLNGLKIKSITTRYSTAYAIDQNDDLWAWGDNSYGQVGDGTSGVGNKRTSPYKVPGLPAVSDVTTSGTTVYIIGKDGSLWAWGRNDYGEIGDGTTTRRTAPVKVPGLPKIADMAVSTFNTYAIGMDGSVWSWGDNQYGGIGNGASGADALQLTPYHVPGLPRISNVAVTAATAYVTGEDGSLWSWGQNWDGQIGDGTTNDRLAPYKVPGLPEVADVEAVGTANVYATGLDGSLWAWGDNFDGQIGNGGNGDDQLTPYKVPIPTKVTKVNAGGGIYYIAYAIDENGALWAWGNNDTGQIGNGGQGDTTTTPDIGDSTTIHSTPYKVDSLPAIADIAAYGGTTYATAVDGSLWTWGWNQHGQVGDGTTVNRFTPYKVPGLPKAVKAIGMLNDLYTVETWSWWSTWMVGADGSVWTWGRNAYGAIGDGTTNDRLTPYKVQGLPVITGVSTSEDHDPATYVTGADGSVWTWGAGWDGQIGDGTTNDRLTPYQIQFKQ